MASFLKGFVYASRGILCAVREERNFRFHLCVALYVYLLTFFYSFGTWQYVALTVIVGSMLALELVNSALERLCNKICREQDSWIRAGKDMAAGAVWVFSLAAIACGILLFWDTNVFASIVAYYGQRPLLLLLPAGLLAAGFLFVFYYPQGTKKE